jgi:hypothetical protein
VYRWFAAQEEWKQKCQAARAAFQYKNLAQPVSRDKIAALYGDRLFPAYTGWKNTPPVHSLFMYNMGLGPENGKYTPCARRTWAPSCMPSLRGFQGLFRRERFHHPEMVYLRMMGVARGIPTCRFQEGAQDAKHPSKET